MQPLRCQLCGETYLGDKRPDRCPYCGADGNELKSPALWIDYGTVDMSEKSKEDCRRAMELEAKNTAFYRVCAANAENQINESIFKRLSKHESEHAELISEVLGEPEPDVSEETCPQKDKDKFAEAHQRESRAQRFYLEAAGRAQNERVRYIFRYIADVESEHLKLSNISG